CLRPQQCQRQRSIENSLESQWVRKRSLLWLELDLNMVLNLLRVDLIRMMLECLLTKLIVRTIVSVSGQSEIC
ncbi:hypothetical protein TELCIR_20649, partial [Teladorsagia circumcincta]